MFLCWENGIGFCWRFALFLECFSDTFLVGCLLLLEQTNSQSFWLFVLALLAIYQWLKVFPGLIGLASFVHCLIGSFLLASLALASLAHSLIGAHWLIGSLAHWGLIGSLAHLRHFWHFFELFSSSLGTLGPQGYLTSSYLSWSLGSG